MARLWDCSQHILRSQTRGSLIISSIVIHECLTLIKRALDYRILPGEVADYLFPSSRNVVILYKKVREQLRLMPTSKYPITLSMIGSESRNQIFSRSLGVKFTLSLARSCIFADPKQPQTSYLFFFHTILFLYWP